MLSLSFFSDLPTSFRAFRTALFLLLHTPSLRLPPLIRANDDHHESCSQSTAPTRRWPKAKDDQGLRLRAN